MRSAGRTVLVALLLGAFGLMLPAVTAAQLRTKSGVINRFGGADNNNSVCTSSTTYRNIPSMAVTFTQSGSGSDEVAVLFEGAGWFAEATEFVAIRLTVDGVVQPGPGAGDDTFIFGINDPLVEANGTASHGFNFQTEALGAGSHTARVQWRSFFGNEVCVGPRSLLVLHR